MRDVADATGPTGETYLALRNRNPNGANAGRRILRAIDAAGDPINVPKAAPWRSPLDQAQSRGSFRGQGPARKRRRAGEGSGELGGEAVQDRPVTEAVALLDTGTRADHRLSADRAAITHDRTRFYDAAAAD